MKINFKYWKIITIIISILFIDSMGYYYYTELEYNSECQKKMKQYNQQIEKNNKRFKDLAKFDVNNKSKMN